jgi:hypothetical protein
MTLRATNIVEITGKITMIASALGWMLSTIAAAASEGTGFGWQVVEINENSQDVSSGMAEAQYNGRFERRCEAADL